MISTQNLSNLPNIDDLKKLAQSLALFSLIFKPNEEDDWLRYHSYYSDWKEGEEVANCNNGSGDEMNILFSKHGAIIAGFGHESEMSPFKHKPAQVWPGVIDTVPDQFKDFITKGSIASTGVTFCIWRSYKDVKWQVGDVKFPDNETKDGSAYLLKTYDNNPATYKKFAKDYYEKDLSLELVKDVYAHKPLTEEMVKQINPKVSLEEIKDGVKLIGYPV